MKSLLMSFVILLAVILASYLQSRGEYRAELQVLQLLVIGLQIERAILSDLRRRHARIVSKIPA